MWHILLRLQTARRSFWKFHVILQVCWFVYLGTSIFVNAFDSDSLLVSYASPEGAVMDAADLTQQPAMAV